jgi:hypothetical protein
MAPPKVIEVGSQVNVIHCPANTDFVIGWSVMDDMVVRVIGVPTDSPDQRLVKVDKKHGTMIVNILPLGEALSRYKEIEGACNVIQNNAKRG